MSSHSLPLVHTPSDRASSARHRAKLEDLRDRFLSDPGIDLSILRPVIARSWQRSMLNRIDPSQRVFCGVAKPLLEERFLRLAEPVVTELGQLCKDARGYVSLSDARGTLALSRGDSSVVRQADRMFSTFGGCMSEHVVGTNSDGTALLEGDDVQVWGAEHFNEAFGSGCCSSVLIRDPLRSSVLGVLSLTLPEDTLFGLDSRVALMLLKSAASQIASGLTKQLAPAEQALLASYLCEVRKRGADAVIAMDGKTTIANRSAIALLDENFVALSGYALEAQHLGKVLEREVICSDDSLLQVQIKPVTIGATVAGTVLKVKSKSKVIASHSHSSSGATNRGFDTLIGKSIEHNQMLKLANLAVQHRLGAYIVGEAGSGKRLLAETLASHGSESWVSLEAGDLTDSAGVRVMKQAISCGVPLVIRHVERFSPECREMIAATLSSVDKPKVYLTMRQISDDLLPLISALRGIEIQVPSMRTKREDISLLVNHFISRVHDGRRATPRLLETLAGVEWKENVRQLKEVVEATALRASTPDVSLADVSEAHRRALARNQLSRLEHAELDLIREALSEVRGNRARAAEVLGIGRATLYRKIDSYTSRGFQI